MDRHQKQISEDQASKTAKERSHGKDLSAAITRLEECRTNADTKEKALNECQELINKAADETLTCQRDLAKVNAKLVADTTKLRRQLNNTDAFWRERLNVTEDAINEDN